jgi:hypothetical protein
MRELGLDGSSLGNLVQGAADNVTTNNGVHSSSETASKLAPVNDYTAQIGEDGFTGGSEEAAE